jgi:hypothetical protein
MQFSSPHGRRFSPHVVQDWFAQALYALLHMFIRHGLQVEGGVLPVSERSASGLLQEPASPPLLEPPLLLETPPSSSLEASPSLLLKPPPPLVFELHAIAAPNEPTITAVHATDLSITASLKVRRSMQDAGGPINGANTVLLQ